MKTTTARWGNSLALRIPAKVAASLRLSDGTEVELQLSHGRLLVQRAPGYSLTELVDAITEENRHPEVDWGAAVGREVW